MFISDFAIQRPIVTVTVMLAIVVFGLAALINLQTDEFPDIQQPVVSVSIPYPGASPEVVEREIVEPVEEAIFGISGLDGEAAGHDLAALDMLVDRRAGSVYRVLRFRKGRAGGIPGCPGRDLRDSRRSPPRNGGAGHPAFRSGGGADRLAHAILG